MSDKENHLTYFKVDNFKRFDSLEMKNLGQFNLIVGDNNVGKTSVLEALLIDEPAHVWINNLTTAFSYKKLKGQLLIRDLEYLNNQEKYLHAKKESVITFSFEKGNLPRKVYALEFNKFKQELSFRGIQNDSTSYEFNFSYGSQNDNLNVPYISLYSGHDKNLTNYYSRVIQRDPVLKRKLIKFMSVMIPDFENIELSAPYSNEPPYLIVTQKNHNVTLPLAMFGDGSIKLFRIILEIIANAGKKLMIDEVDAGIHYSRFKEFWKIILQAADENDVQLFMTTHNEECIKYFKEVLETDLMKLQKDARSITLIETPSGEVKAFTYTFSQLGANLEVGNEIRGGSR